MKGQDGQGNTLAFMVETMATASVLAIMLPNKAQYCQVHPSLRRSSTYSMMGISSPQLPITTRKASVRIFTHAYATQEAEPACRYIVLRMVPCS